MDDSGQEPDVTRGLPQTRANALTPLGGIEQVGKIADVANGLPGWRRTLARIAVVLLALAIGLPLILWAVPH